MNVSTSCEYIYSPAVKIDQLLNKKALVNIKYRLYYFSNCENIIKMTVTDLYLAKVCPNLM